MYRATIARLLNSVAGDPKRQILAALSGRGALDAAEGSLDCCADYRPIWDATAGRKPRLLSQLARQILDAECSGKLRRAFREHDMRGAGRGHVLGALIAEIGQVEAGE